MRYKTLLLVLSMLFVFSACDDDDDDSSPEISKGDIAIGTSLPNPDGTTGSSYLQLVEDFKQMSIDNSRAEQIPYSGPCFIYGEDIFVLPGLGGDVMYKFSRNENKELIKTGELVFPANSTAFNFLKVTDEKAYVSFMGIAKIWVINPKTMTKMTEIDLSGYGVGDANPDASAMRIRDGKLYVSLIQMVGGFFPDPFRPYTDILIINTTNNTPEKMVTDSLSGLSTPTRPYDSNTLFMDENNDLYVVCLGAFGFVPGHKTGIHRIKNGETEFDTSYAFVINDVEVSGELPENKIDVVLGALYMGNGKLYANANFPAYYSNQPDQYNDRTARPVVIDLVARTVTLLPFDRSNQFATVNSMDDKVIFGLVTESKQGFFSYDILTKTASQNPVITTTSYPWYIDRFEN